MKTRFNIVFVKRILFMVLIRVVSVAEEGMFVPIRVNVFFIIFTANSIALVIVIPLEQCQCVRTVRSVEFH